MNYISITNVMDVISIRRGARRQVLLLPAKYLESYFTGTAWNSKQNSHFIFEMLGNVSLVEFYFRRINSLLLGIIYVISFQTTNLTMGYQNQGVGFSKICI